MAATALTVAQPSDRSRRVIRWLAMTAGLLGVFWWIRIWSDVHSLITEHLRAHGPLPGSAMDRAALYANGTPAEQALSSDLGRIAGLYPWGRLPLILAVIAILVGWFMSGSTSPVRAGIGIGASLLLLSIPLILLGDSMAIALDILE